MECPSAFAFLAAISAEIAMSPANPVEKFAIGGNDKTSVGISFPRKRRFNACNSLLLVTRILIDPFSLTARAAFPANRASVDSRTPGTGLRTIIKLVSPEKENRRAPDRSLLNNSTCSTLRFLSQMLVAMYQIDRILHPVVCHSKTALNQAAKVALPFWFCARRKPE